MADLAVIVVNYRTPDLAVACVEAMAPARAAFPGLRAIVVDGGSGDGSAERIADGIAAQGAGGWARLLALPVNGGFAFANNRALIALAAEGALPDYVALINPDARVRPGALEAMAALLDRRPEAGAVGARLVHEDGRPQASAFHFPSVRGEICRGARTGVIDRLLRQPASRIEPEAATRVPWVTGAAVMFRARALAEAGPFDEGFFLYFEETDLLRRIATRGWEIWHEPAAHVFHHGGAATQIRDPETGLPRRQRMARYWYESRLRYFTLAGGRGYALASGLGWLAGRLVWKLRLAFTGRKDDGPLQATGDFIRYSLWPRRRDGQAAIPALRLPAPELPAWMAR
ncbi:glycosyltransferase family 2 protein [Sphingomonas quercus]|uniref:Glycosyltransferase family 2 protein n=1 Tax=Sphingomonas quercus TaxID=2842451 RepID=A0ABS6BFY1_9SPHN|nr:glycosyltransferase family 2 protein [Sphingomonas quercus]